MCSGRVGGSCSISGIRRVNLVTNPVISHEWGKDLRYFYFILEARDNIFSTIEINVFKLQL
jgi:hypothetical protein